ncbi:MAG: hypothetical protein LBC38_04905 [Oscillospiraceae bacterium]|jgi:hypothetical protein|nr:hypothetical protein [Oscillospiraceae bacterium]
MAKLKKVQLSADEAEILVEQYDALRKQESEIKKQKDKISDQLKAYAESAGTKDVKGSYYVQSEKYIFGKQARTSVAFVHDIAVEALTKCGYVEAIDVVRTVNEDRFEQLVGEGKVSVDDFIDMGAISQKTTYAIFVKPIEEMSEIEVAQLVRSKV